MKILDRFINPLIDREVDKRIEALIKKSQEHNSVMVGNPLAWSWASTIPDSYYPNAVLRDGTRSPTADLPMDTHKLTGLSVPASNGDSIRQTTKITEAKLEGVVDSCNVVRLSIRDFIHDDGAGGKAISSMVFIPPFITAGLPQAALNGLEMGNFFVDVYKNSQPSATSISRGVTAANTPGAIAACSRPGVVPWTDIDWLNARIASSNRVINGRSCHLITPYEKASLLYLQMMGNFIPKGNNNNGKDTRDAATFNNYGILDPVKPDYRTLTGTGPASWWSNGIPNAGIFGLVGNIYEWEDVRLANGLYKPKGYLSGAATAADTHIDYDDNAGGDGVDICHLMPGVYTIADDGVHGVEDVIVERVIVTGRFTGRLILSAGLSADHNDNTLIQLKTAVDISVGEAGAYKAIGKLLEDATSKKLAFPDKSDVATHIATYLDSWYVKEIVDCALRRAGYWNDTTRARRGLFVNTATAPSDAYSYVGFRSALSIGNL